MHGAIYLLINIKSYMKYRKEKKKVPYLHFQADINCSANYYLCQGGYVFTSACLFVCL